MLWAVNTDFLGLNDSHKKNRTVNRIQNIILETSTQSEQIAENAAISDKNNINSAPVQDLTKEEEYNFASPNLAKAQGQGGDSSYIPQEESQTENAEKSINTDEGIQRPKEEQKSTAGTGGGETAPTLIDPDKKQVINLYNSGAASVQDFSMSSTMRTVSSFRFECSPSCANVRSWFCFISLSFFFLNFIFFL